jgi:transporter family-2 protein
LNVLFAAIISAAMGAGVAIQIAMNGQNRGVLGHPFHAALLNIAGALTSCLLVMLLLRLAWPSAEQYRALPPLNWLTGLFGVSYLVISAWLVPQHGAAKVFLFALVGQLLATALIDHIGAFDTPEQPLSPLRALGLVLVFVGAVCVIQK